MPVVDPKSVLDTSKMSPAQREALELTEAARESTQAKRGFAGDLFMGHFDVTGIHPFQCKTRKTWRAVTFFCSDSGIS